MKCRNLNLVFISGRKNCIVSFSIDCYFAVQKMLCVPLFQFVKLSEIYVWKQINGLIANFEFDRRKEEIWDMNMLIVYAFSAQQAPARKNPPLLADPRYTAAPTPYEGKIFVKFFIALVVLPRPCLSTNFNVCYFKFDITVTETCQGCIIAP